MLCECKNCQPPSEGRKSEVLKCTHGVPLCIHCHEHDCQHKPPVQPSEGRKCKCIQHDEGKCCIEYGCVCCKPSPAVDAVENKIVELRDRVMDGDARKEWDRQLRALVALARKGETR